MKAPAKALVMSEESSYLETNSTWNVLEEEWTYSRDQHDIAGPIPFLASSEYGLGRVVAIGDTGIFINDFYGEGQSQFLMMNILGWLSEAQLQTQYVLEAKYPAAQTIPTVMEGGSAVYTYVLNSKEGIPLKNYTTTYTLNGSKREVTTNERGEFEVITPSLKQIKTHTFSLKMPGTESAIELRAHVIPLQFEQSWHLTAGVEGKAGLGIGVEGKFGKDNGFTYGVGLDAGGMQQNMLTMKYAMDGKYYDLIVQPAYSEGVIGGVSGGIQGKLKKGGELSLIDVEAQAGISRSKGGALTFEQFNNIHNLVLNNDIALSLMYEIIAISVARNGKLMDNQLVQFVLDEIEKKLDHNLYNRLSTFEALNMASTLDVNFLKAEFEKLNIDLGLVSVGHEQTATFSTEWNGKDEMIKRNILNGQLSAEYLTYSLNYMDEENDVEYEIENILNALDHDVTVEAVDEIVSSKGKVNEYTYAMTFGANSSLSEQDTLKTIKYTFNRDNLENLQNIKKIQSILNNQFTFLKNVFTIPFILQREDVQNEQIAYEELETVEDGFDHSMGIGLGAGLKVKLGFDLIGVSSVEYVKKKGVAEQGVIYPEVQYDQHTLVQKRQEQLSNVFEVISERVGLIIQGAFEKAVELGENLIGFVKETGQLAVTAVTQQYVTMKDELIGEVKRIKVGLSKITDSFGLNIQTEHGSAQTIGEIFILTFNDEKSGEAMYDLGETTVPLTIGYSDELLQRLGLQNNERDLAIYRWDEDKVTYVKTDSYVNVEDQSVTVHTSLSGQYILAYNELDPQVQDVVFSQKGNALAIQSVVKDGFEYVDPATISVEVNGQMYDAQQFDYNSSTGDLMLVLEDLEEGADIVARIHVGEKVSERFTHKMVRSRITPKRTTAHVTEKGATFQVEFERPDDVQSATVVYSVDGTSVNFEHLTKEGATWSLQIEDSNIAEVHYKIQYVTVANELLETDIQSAFASNVAPLQLISPSSRHSFADMADEIKLTFNYALMKGSQFDHIQAIDQTGEPIGVMTKIKGNQLMITPAYAMPEGEVTIMIPKGALRARTQSPLINETPIEFVYESVNMRQLPTKQPKEPWTVTFSEAVEIERLRDFLYVTDMEGKVVATTIKKQRNGNQVSITPVEQYDIGETYILYVSDDLYANGKKLNRQAMKVFKVTK